MLSPLDIDGIRNAVDLAVVVLLWLVQLIIYPGFLQIQREQLKRWHQTYTFRASFIIIPLLCTQLCIIIMQLAREQSLQTIASTVIVVACWLLTFFVSVPLHRKVETGFEIDQSLRKLVLTNWPRTILWTTLCLIGLID